MAREQADHGPTWVVLYTWGRENGAPPRPLLEFTWTPADGVECTVFDHDYADGAKRYLKQGANLEQERRMAHPDEGPVFLRALLGHGNSSSYYWFVDKSPET
jgi:hypothetical protein